VKETTKKKKKKSKKKKRKKDDSDEEEIVAPKIVKLSPQQQREVKVQDYMKALDKKKNFFKDIE
jgi:hypothetical protein